MNNRVCAECGRTFQPSSGHLRCPKCRWYNFYDLCGCGARKGRQATTCLACATTAGASNGHWKGGRTKHKAGYIMVLAPGHPRATTAGKYVFEHVLVMEEMLGRYLLPRENVHHRNGIKDDNRPENLELWAGPQPTGIRATDAVAWAREILERYEAGLVIPGTIEHADQ
jgi:HNH endonuclease